MLGNPRELAHLGLRGHCSELDRRGWVENIGVTKGLIQPHDPLTLRLCEAGQGRLGH